MRAEPNGPVVSESANFLQQRRRRIDQRSIGAGHEGQTRVLQLRGPFLLLVDEAFNGLERVRGLLGDARGNDFAFVHDRACEYRPYSRFANGPDRLFGAVRVWVEEVVLANGGHAALESLHTAQQR